MTPSDISYVITTAVDEIKKMIPKMIQDEVQITPFPLETALDSIREELPDMIAMHMPKLPEIEMLEATTLSSPWTDPARVVIKAATSIVDLQVKINSTIQVKVENGYYLDNVAVLNTTEVWVAIITLRRPNDE